MEHYIAAMKRKAFLEERVDFCTRFNFNLRVANGQDPTGTAISWLHPAAVSSLLDAAEQLKHWEKQLREHVEANPEQAWFDVPRIRSPFDAARPLGERRPIAVVTPLLVTRPY